MRSQLSALSYQSSVKTFLTRLQYLREFFFSRCRARAALRSGNAPILAATKNTFMAHQLGSLSGNCADRSHSPVFDILGGAAFAARRNSRKTGDLFFLASGSVRRRVV